MKETRKRFQHVIVEEHISFSPHTNKALDQFLDTWYKSAMPSPSQCFYTWSASIIRMGLPIEQSDFIFLLDEHQLLLQHEVFYRAQSLLRLTSTR